MERNEGRGDSSLVNRPPAVETSSVTPLNSRSSSRPREEQRLETSSEGVLFGVFGEALDARDEPFAEKHDMKEARRGTMVNRNAERRPAIVRSWGETGKTFGGGWGWGVGLERR